MSRSPEIALSRCDLRFLPEALRELPWIEALSLRNNALVQIPAWLGDRSEFPNLRWIDLRRNPLLSSVPPLAGVVLEWHKLVETGYSPLSSVVGVQFNNLSSLPPDSKGLVELREIVLRSPEGDVAQLLEELVANWPRLNDLVLENADLRELPPCLAQLRELRGLACFDTAIASLPGWVFSLPLERLQAVGTQITTLPSEILALNHLELLEVDSQNISTPPAEVVSRGLDAIRAYWRDRETSGVAYISEAKLLIVGEAGAGKTSLARKLLDPHYRLDGDEASTKGIDVRRWSFPFTLRPKRAGATAVQTEFIASIWDFGGQEIYHATHQFFLTRRSLYVLVADERKEDANFDYWLSGIGLFAADAPVIIVRNKKQGRCPAIDERSMRARFKNLVDIVDVDLAEDPDLGQIRLDQVRRRIMSLLEGLPHIGDELPASWRSVRQALERDGRDYIREDEFQAVCREHGCQQDDAINSVGDFVHDLGICLYFRDDPVLKNLVILRPQWGTDAVYRVLDAPDVVRANGRFGRDLLRQIWSEQTYAGKQHELVQLMSRFELCYQLDTRAAWVAPQLLKPERPTYSWSHREDDLVLRYEYEFMPKGIVRRLIVALNDSIAESGTLAWRTGAVFADGETRCEVIEDYPRRRIIARAQGPKRHLLVYRMHQELERIHRSFPGLVRSTMVPCECKECAASSEPYAFKLEVLEKFARKRAEIQCLESGAMVAPEPLIAAIFGRAFDAGNYIDLRPGPDRKGRAFVSYAWSAPTALVDTLVERLGARGISIERDVDDIGYRGSIQEFMDHLGTGAAVVVVLSAAYLRSKYCMSELIAIHRAGKLRDRIFPVILEPGLLESEQLIDHVEYWETKLNELDAKAKRVQGANLKGIQRDLTLYAEIRATIDDIASILRDMNMLTPAIHQDTDFSALVAAIDAKLSEPD